MKKQSTKNRLETIKTYYALTKPGIVRGNLVTAAAGFLFAAYGDVEVLLLAATLAGISLLIASACVLNNYVDRNIDALMDRTKARALASNMVSTKSALVYTGLLGFLGFSLLAVFTNDLTVALGVIALVNYVVFYGLAKRKSIHGTLVGSISGALPITAGYTAYAGRLDQGAILLFLILVLWQMPHFYAIAIYRLKDYKAAGLPVLPIVAGLRHTKFQMLIYIVLFLSAVIMLAAQGYAGKTYLAVMALAGFWWLYEATKGFYTAKNTLWAKRMFSVSLMVLVVFSIMISVDNFLA